MKVNVQVEVQSDEEVQDAVVKELVSDLNRRIERNLSEEVRLQVSAAINGRVESIVMGVFDEGFQETNRYGEVTNPRKITMKELIEKKAVEWLQQKVDRSGVASSWSDSKERSIYIAEKHAEELIQKVLKPAVDEIVKSIKSEAQGKIAKIVTDSINALATGR